MKTKFEVGATVDMMAPHEHRKNLNDALDRITTDRARGVKHMRMSNIQGTASNSSLVIGHGQNQVGPREGFTWSIQRLVVSGLTSGATPDILNFYINNHYDVPLWQLNGNSFGASFSKLQLTMYGGDILIAASVGTFAATGVITVAGEVIEVPAELMWKLTS